MFKKKKGQEEEDTLGRAPRLAAGWGRVGVVAGAAWIAGLNERGAWVEGGCWRWSGRLRSEVHMAEPESQCPQRWSQAGWGGLGAGLFSERSTVPVACLLFLQGFFFCSLEEGPLLAPRNKHCPIRCLPLLWEFLFLILPWRRALWSCFPLRISTFNKVRTRCRSSLWVGGGRQRRER